MQDWEWEVADPRRIPEFLAAYARIESNDELFVLLEMLLQSFEDSPRDLETDSLWRQTLHIAETNIERHISTIWYWACVDEDNPEHWWRITPYIRSLWAAHRRRFGMSDA